LVLYPLNAAAESAVSHSDGGREMVPRKANVLGPSEKVEVTGRTAAGALEAAIGKEAEMNPNEQQQLRAHIRWMIRRDMAEVLEIEREGFEFPWSEDDFIRCLRQRNCIGMVAEHDDRVIGFMIYELHKTRLHLLNFSVAAAYRRRGAGTQMLSKLVAKLSSQRRTRILLEVRETNLAAQLFFRRMNFRAVSVLRDFYDDTTEDAYLMQYRYRPVESEIIVPVNRITRLAG
jgi:[ribosomal protein S18]-alanine N-acetyltransferase